MIFGETELPGSYIIELERLDDERGFFARSWCEREFRAQGLDDRIVQCNISFNKKRGTLRGMHYQVDPHAETKLIRCTRGAIHDVIVDLRRDSPTYMRHVAIVLSAENRKMLYVPKGFAHGFQTLEDNTEVFYQMSDFYSPASSRGFRWDDPAFRIPWPQATRTISMKDLSYPDFCQAGA
ncbi:MAG TPA: dTDP-4-dehydrorhamnose 3,5-epimerase [Nitrospiraceae bacterium]|nr:dTDP-4-dehydrorhamnose 3,5-epimerase [Nitrospiraceae bacterium]